MKKITLKEFWNSNKGMVIHCDTEEKANQLLKAFHKLGKKWLFSGASYLRTNYWSIKRKNTCYDNKYGYQSLNWYKKHIWTIYEFEDVDLGA